MTHTVLQFDYAEVDGLAVIAAKGITPLLCDDGTWVYDKIVLELEDMNVVVISVTESSDELIFDKFVSNSPSIEASISGENAVSLSDFNGLELGWCWIGTNWRGYKDMVTLSFAGMQPQVAFLAQAAKISVYRLQVI